MKVKAVSLYSAVKSGAFAEILNVEFPFKIAYRLSKASRKAGDDYKDIEAARSKLVDKYGVKSEDGKSTTVHPDNLEKFSAEFEELMAEELDLEGVETIVISDDVASKVKIKPSILLELDWLIEEAEQTKKDTGK